MLLKRHNAGKGREPDIGKRPARISLKSSG